MTRKKKRKFKRIPAYKKMPGGISHRTTRRGILSLWRGIATRIYSPQVLGALPPFCQVLAKTFWEADDHAIIDAMMDGDPAFFIAYQIRLDQIHVALADANADISARAPVIRCKYTLDGFRQAASENLVRQGGKWPLQSPSDDAPS